MNWRRSLLPGLGASRGRLRARTARVCRQAGKHQLEAAQRAAPSGYGLGASGWVTVPVDAVALDVLRDWVEESYRIVAPKRLVAMLDERPSVACIELVSRA